MSKKNSEKTWGDMFWDFVNVGVKSAGGVAGAAVAGASIREAQKWYTSNESAKPGTQEPAARQEHKVEAASVFISPEDQQLLAQLKVKREIAQVKLDIAKADKERAEIEQELQAQLNHSISSVILPPAAAAPASSLVRNHEADHSGITVSGGASSIDEAYS